MSPASEVGDSQKASRENSEEGEGLCIRVLRLLADQLRDVRTLFRKQNNDEFLRMYNAHGRALLWSHRKQLTVAYSL